MYLCFRITRFLEKPPEGLTTSRLASVVFYCIQKDTLSYLSDFLRLQPRATDRTFGQFWVCSDIEVRYGLLYHCSSLISANLKSGSFIGVANQWEAAGCVWDEAPYWLPAHWTSGLYLLTHFCTFVFVNVALKLAIWKRTFLWKNDVLN